MRRSNRLTLLVSMVFILRLVPFPVYACSCAEPGTPEESLAAADAVFAGEVVAIVAPEPVDGMISSADPVKVTFDVEQVWKGPLNPELTLTTPLMDASVIFFRKK